MAGIPIIDGFEISAAKPADTRTNVQTIAQRDATPFPFHGIEVFVRDTNKKYKLEADLTTWTEIGTGGGGGAAVEGRTVYISTLGNDTTGAEGNPSFPFLTLNAAYTFAKTLTPTSSNPVTIYLQAGTFAEDITLDTSYINIKAVIIGSKILDPLNPGLTSAYTPGNPAVAGVPAIGGWTEFDSFGDYAGDTFVIGGETWTGVANYTGAPFTFGPTSNFTPDIMFNNLVSNFNANNTNGLRMHFNFGTLRNDSGSYSFGCEGVTVTTTGAEAPNFSSKNGIVLDFPDPNGNLGGSQVSPTAEGVDAIPIVHGVGTPIIQREYIIDGNITIDGGVITILEGFDCNNINFEGTSTNSSFKNLHVYSDIASAFPDANSWVDVHAAYFLSDADCDGSYIDCSGFDYPFAGRGDLSGFVSNCHSRDYGYGYTQQQGAVITSSFGRNFCFGRPEIGTSIRGQHLNCFGNDNCFAGESNTIGRFLTCIGNNRCFGFINNIISAAPNFSTSINFNQTVYSGCRGRDECFVVNGGGGAGNVIDIFQISVLNCTARRDAFIHVAFTDGLITKTSTAPSNFTNCIMTSASDGIVSCQASGGSIVLQDIVFTSCSKRSSNVGEAICSHNNGTMSLTDVVFLNCTADYILNSADPTDPLTFDGISFINCVATEDFCTMTSGNANLSLTKLVIKNCTGRRLVGFEVNTALVANEGNAIDNFTQNQAGQMPTVGGIPFAIRNTYHHSPFSAAYVMQNGGVVYNCVFTSATGNAIQGLVPTVTTNVKIWNTVTNNAIHPNLANAISPNNNIVDPDVQI